MATQTIYQLMDDVFTYADIPGRLNEWRVTVEEPDLPAIFAVYVNTEKSGDFFADDVPVVTRYELNVHVWGTTDITAKVEALIDALRHYDFDVLRSADIPDTAGSEYIYHNKIEVVRWE